jgi:tetratricopeptide (TPR) repeat protein
MGFRYPQPDNEDGFELFCLRLLRNAWNRPHLQQNGKRGERQDGVDLIDLGGEPPFRGVQCKHHEPAKTIPPSEIELEVTKALGHDPPLEEFYILTTARKAGLAQKTVLKINRKHRAEGKFLVVLWHWEEIEQCLDGLDEVAQDRVMRGDTGRSVANLQAVLPPLFQQALDSLGPGSPSAIDSELDEAKAEMERFRHEVVQHKLDRLEDRHADRLSEQQRFRLLTIRANLAIRGGEWQRAAELLLRAKALQPHEERARINEVLAHELRGDTRQAHALATSLRSEFGSSGKLAAIWVRTAPADLTFEQVESEVGAIARSDGEVALSLAYRALQCEHFDAGLRYVAQARERDPDAAQVLFLFAQILHCRGLRATPVARRLHELREVEARYAEAIDRAAAQCLSEIETAARLSRAVVRAYLGDTRAEADFHAALKLRPRDPSVRLRYAFFLLDTGRCTEALGQAESVADGPSLSEARFLSAAARFERNSGDDRDQAVDILVHLAEQKKSPRRTDALHLALDGLIEKERWENADSLLVRSGLEGGQPGLFFALSARIRLAQGDTAAALSLASRSREALSGQASLPVLRLLAQVFVQLQRDQDALPLLERCARPGEFDADTRRLLDCAVRLKRHDIVLRVCREVREAGEGDRRLLDLEVSTLHTYDPPRAAELLQDILRRHPEDRLARLQLTAVGLHCERPELVDANPAVLPAPGDVEVPAGLLAVQVLRRTGQEQAALDFAYELLRRNFDSEHAHGVYIATILLGARRRPPLRSPEVVGAGTAVCYQEDDDCEHWVVFDGGEATGLPDERPTDGPLAREVFGKHVGDRFRLAAGAFQDRMATVRAIANKHVYRYEDCLNQFQVRFSASSAFQLVRVVNDGAVDLTPIYRSLDEQRARVEGLQRLYRDQLMPVFLFAQTAGSDELAALHHLAGTPGLGIRCCAGSPEELERASTAFRSASAVVLDVTALYTLARLGRLDVLRRCGRRFVIGQATFDLLRGLAERWEDSRRGAICGPATGGVAIIWSK